MIDTAALKKKILDFAIEGKLSKRDCKNKTCELFELIQKEKEYQLKNGLLKKTKPFPKITQDKIPGDFPKEWYICYIDDIAFVTKLAGFEYTKYIADNIQNEGIPLFKGKNVQHGELVLEFESFIPHSISDELPRSQLKKKCLLTPYVGTIGNIAIFEGEFDAHLGSNVGKIELLNSDKEVYLLEEYVLYYLRSSYGYAELTKHRKATAQDSISIEAIRNVILPIPSLEEQREIVNRVNEILEQIELIDDLQAQYSSDLEVLKSKIIDAGIQGKLTEQLPEDGTAEELLRQIAKEKKQLLKEKKIKATKALPEITEDEIPFEIPDNWKWVRIQELIEKDLGGGTPSKAVPEYWDNGNIPWASVKDFSAAEGGYLVDTIDHITQEGLENSSANLADEKSIVICMRMGLGKIARVAKPMAINQDLRAIWLNKAVLEDYFVLFYSTLRIEGRGMTVAGIRKNELMSMVFPLPPISEQKRIVEKIQQIMSSIYC